MALAATCSLILLSLIHTVTAVNYNERLSCPWISCYHSTKLKHCHFVNTSDIQCTMYSESKAESKILPVKSILEYRTVFYLQTASPTICRPSGQNSYCLGLRSTLLRIVEDIPEPEEEANKFTFPNDVTQNLKIAKFGSYLYIEFFSNISTGFVTLKPQCNNDQTGGVLEDSCIEDLQASTLVINPGDYMMDKPTDDQFDKAQDLYLTVMGGRMKELTLSTNIPSTGVNASKFLQFLTPTKIERLNVSDNSFSNLPHRLFSLYELRELYISACGMSSIHPENFVNTPNLRILDLSRNQLREIPVGLSTLTHLEDLDLSGQRIGAAFKLTNELANMKMLRVLKMSRMNTLQEISRAAFPKNLEYLDLSHCRISNLQSDTFSDLTLLKILILSYNNIAIIPSNIFKPLKSLSKLYLNSNKIANKPQISVNSLAVLDLSSNKITTPNKLISEGTIDKLNLSRNLIVNWTDNYVFHSENFKIKHLNLSYNHLTIVNDLMKPSIKLLESIDIGGNILNCIDCSIKSFQSWLRAGNHSNILNLNSTDDLICNEPYTLYGKSVFDVQYNSTLCDVVAPDYVLIFATPFGILLTLVIASVIVGYRFRFEIAYVRHLFNVKKRNERQEKSGCSYDLFVSYSSKDREWVVNVLLEKLESPEEGFQLCLHERDFLLGTYIMDNIVNCIEKSRRTLLVLTENYIESEWCRWELQMAQHRVFEVSNDFLILLELKRLDRERLPLHLRQLMGSRTYLEWPSELSKQDSFWTRLRMALGKPLARVEPEVVVRQEEEEDPWMIAMRAAEGSRQQFLTAIGFTDDITV